MLLGLSGSTVDDEIDPGELGSGAGVPHGELLVRLVDASFDDRASLAGVRDECVDVLGYDATVDAIAVIANFHMMTRIADGTGTPIDDGSHQMTGEIRAALDIDGFESMRLDPTA